MTAPTCRDLPELIESDPATAWSWGDPLGGLHSLPSHDWNPACERAFQQKEEPECG